MTLTCQVRFGGGLLEKCLVSAGYPVTRQQPTLPGTQVSLMVWIFSLRARKGIYLSGAEAPFPMEKGTAQRLTQRPKGRWGHKRDAKRESDGSIKPMCFSEQARQGES